MKIIRNLRLTVALAILLCITSSASGQRKSEIESDVYVGIWKGMLLQFDNDKKVVDKRRLVLKINNIKKNNAYCTIVKYSDSTSLRDSTSIEVIGTSNTSSLTLLLPKRLFSKDLQGEYDIKFKYEKERNTHFLSAIYDAPSVDNIDITLIKMDKYHYAVEDKKQVVTESTSSSNKQIPSKDESVASSTSGGSTIFISQNPTSIDVDEMFVFNDGYAVVRKGESYAMIDKTGKIVIPFNKYLYTFNNGTQQTFLIQNTEWVSLSTGMVSIMASAEYKIQKPKGMGCLIVD